MKNNTTGVWIIVGILALIFFVSASSHGTPPTNNSCTLSVAGMAVSGLNCSQPPVSPPPVVPPVARTINLLGTGNVVFSGNTITSSGPINFEATSPNGATSIEFYIDSTWLGRDQSVPYTLYPYAQQPPVGKHNLTVIAYTGTYPTLNVVGYEKYAFVVN